MGETESISPRTAVTNTLPGIILDIAAAVLIWLFGRLVFLPISEGIDVFGYPLTEILNFIILVSLIIIVLKVLGDVRVFIGGLTGWIAEKIGTTKIANMVMIGAYIKRTNAVKLDSVINSLSKVFTRAKKDMFKKNEEALKQGMEV